VYFALRFFAALEPRHEDENGEILEKDSGKKVFHKSATPLVAGLKQSFPHDPCNNDVTQIRPREAHKF
jgi:hypothetical protein